LLLTVSLQAGHPLSVSVYPTKCFAPAEVRVRVWIEPHADNRALDIVADSWDFYRRSVFELEGDKAPRSIEWRLRALPDGEYLIKATLTDSAGLGRATAQCRLSIISESDP
jgi:hypothetical protein